VYKTGKVELCLPVGRQADPKKTYTRQFERFVLELSKLMTIKDVAEHLVISWDTVKDIQQKYLKKHFSKPKLSKLKLVAIDEISIGKAEIPHYCLRP